MTLTERLGTAIGNAGLRCHLHDGSSVPLIVLDHDARSNLTPRCTVSFGGSNERGIEFRLGQLVVNVYQPFGHCFPERLLADIARTVAATRGFAVVDVLDDTPLIAAGTPQEQPVVFAHSIQIRSSIDWQEASES